MMLSKPLAMVVITYIVGRIFTAVSAVSVIVIWACAPYDIPSIKTWSDGSWILYYLVPCYLFWSFLGWFHDTLSYKLLLSFESFYGDDDLAAADK